MLGGSVSRRRSALRVAVGRRRALLCTARRASSSSRESARWEGADAGAMGDVVANWDDTCGRSRRNTHTQTKRERRSAPVCSVQQCARSASAPLRGAR